MDAVKQEALAKLLAVSLEEGKAKTLHETNFYTVDEAVANRLGDTSRM